jgi:P27 family predicted phage terminase small subunit
MTFGPPRVEFPKHERTKKMIAHKLPPEMHLVKGTKGQNMGALLPDNVKSRIPFAEWLHDGTAFDRERFIKETSDYLFDVYGLGSNQDRHTLTMLADAFQLYVNARDIQFREDLVIYINGGKTMVQNPAINIATQAMKNALALMNELGLTPKSRLKHSKPEEDSSVAKFLRGPKG